MTPTLASDQTWLAPRSKRPITITAMADGMVTYNAGGAPSTRSAGDFLAWIARVNAVEVGK